MWHSIVSLKRRQFEVGEKRMVLASFLVSPVFLILLRLSQHPEQSSGGGLPQAVVPVIILLILLLIFLSSYFTSTGIRGKAVAGVSHDSHAPHHHDETALVKAPETAVILSEPVPSAITLVEEEPAPVTPDDLKIVEGVGPKIEEILHAAGIKTFAQLAATSVSQLEQIVREDAGIRIAFPDTWPEQARLAAAEDWAALEKLQEELKGGRRE
jgi:predicted flap endonuclease-1-like 5' DNA nuclease